MTEKLILITFMYENKPKTSQTFYFFLNLQVVFVKDSV